MNTVNKLKKLILVQQQQQQQHTNQGFAYTGFIAATAATAATATTDCAHCVNNQSNYQSITPTESAHLRAVLTKCPYQYVNGVQQPMSPGSAPVPVITVPASQTTAQIINATVAAAGAAAGAVAAVGRFSEYFPPPVPPPQQLQPGFVKYNINYGPKYVVPPCVGPRLYRA